MTTDESWMTALLTSSHTTPLSTETPFTEGRRFKPICVDGAARAPKRTRTPYQEDSVQLVKSSDSPSTSGSCQMENASLRYSAYQTNLDALPDHLNDPMTGVYFASMQSEIQKPFDESIVNCLNTTTAANISTSGTLTKESMDAVLDSTKHLRIQRSIFWIELDGSTMDKLIQLPAEQLPPPLRGIDCYPIFAPGVWESRIFEPARYAMLLSRTLSAALSDSSSNCDLKQASLQALSTVKVYECAEPDRVFDILQSWGRPALDVRLTKGSSRAIWSDPSSPSESPPVNSNSNP